MQTNERLPHLVADVGIVVLTRFVDVVEGVAFWVAVGAPLLYIPVIQLYDNGQVSLAALAGLAGVNLVALVVGHRYNRSGTDSVTPRDESQRSLDTRTDGE